MIWKKNEKKTFLIDYFTKTENTILYAERLDDPQCEVYIKKTFTKILYIFCKSIEL